MQTRTKPDNGTAVQQALPPRCQECGSDPAALTVSFINIMGARVAVFHCAVPECRAIHGVQLLAVPDTPRRESGIIIPS